MPVPGSRQTCSPEHLERPRQHHQASKASRLREAPKPRHQLTYFGCSCPTRVAGKPELDRHREHPRYGGLRRHRYTHAHSPSQWAIRQSWQPTIGELQLLMPVHNVVYCLTSSGGDFYEAMSRVAFATLWLTNPKARVTMACGHQAHQALHVRASQLLGAADAVYGSLHPTGRPPSPTAPSKPSCGMLRAAYQAELSKINFP